MNYIDINKIKDDYFSLESPLKETTSIADNLAAKLEAQRWCLGLNASDLDLNFHSLSDGTLIRNMQRDFLQTFFGMEIEDVNKSEASILPTNAPNWMTIAERERALNVQEVPGRAANPRISEYLKSVGLGASDEIFWCSAFVNWVMEQANFKGTNSGLARSWLNWGIPISPIYGCIVVKKRGSSPTGGHVGFYIGTKNNRIVLLGGNQSNKVCISSYNPAEILGYRWPSEVKK